LPPSINAAFAASCSSLNLESIALLIPSTWSFINCTSSLASSILNSSNNSSLVKEGYSFLGISFGSFAISFVGVSS